MKNLILVEFCITIPNYDGSDTLTYMDLDIDYIKSINLDKADELLERNGSQFNQDTLYKRGVVFMFSGVDENLMVVNPDVYKFNSSMSRYNNVDNKIKTFIRDRELNKLI